MNQAIEALGEIDFNWVRPLDSVWSDADTTGAGPNEAVLQAVIAEFLRDTKVADNKPRGSVVLGQSGVGKTHLVGLLRRKMWQEGGWFVLLDVLGLADFWRTTALSFLTSLLQEMPDGRRQFEAVLAGVARRYRVEEQVEIAFRTPGIEPRKIVDLLVGGLMKTDFNNALRHQDVFRALSLLRAGDLNSMSLAYSWLQGYDADEAARVALGFRGPPPAPVELVRGMSWVMSLAGPTMVAVDQIDSVVSPSSINPQAIDDLDAAKGLAEVLAAGLLELHDVRHRGKTIITCLDASWDTIKERGTKPFLQRFGTPMYLVGMRDAAAVKTLLINRLAPAFEKAGFTPPFPTYPFSEAAIAGAASAALMPRTILIRCDAFRRTCIEQSQVRICDTLIEAVVNTPPLKPPVGVDGEYANFRAEADIAGLIKPDDDSAFGLLLREVFDLYARQIEPNEAIDVVNKSDPPQNIPPLHGRVTFIYHEENDRERHFCFRVLEHANAIAFQGRLRAALTASGISTRMADRHLALVRRSPVPSGSRTRQLVDLFEKSGGRWISPSDDDLRTFVALRRMSQTATETGKQDHFDLWLRSQKPLNDTAFFKEAGLSPSPLALELKLSGATPPAATLDRKTELAVAKSTTSLSSAKTEPVATPGADRSGQKPGTLSEPPNSPTVVVSTVATEPGTIPLGRRVGIDGELMLLPTKVLRRHTSIIAGTGSGKTVLLRRIVEEAALAGLPAIVIDPNNDLSRLGDPWPTRPAAFTAEDDAKAEAYHDRVEVVVWTPGASRGRPLFLSVMPDFASLADDQDERQQAVEMAAETLGPLAGARNQLQRGVLTEALRYFAKQGGGDLRHFTNLLSDLPDGLSPINNAGRLAAGMADQLHASVATNPLLKVDGPVLDPKLLFYGADPARVRVSVVNLSGLNSDLAKQDFVNRLQMTLFGWIKKHPASRGLLYVVDEAQMFLPAQGTALSLGSGVRLFAQARKYGLGMIVATQAPKGIHNQIVANCTTQFFGKQNGPTPMHTVQEMIAAAGGRADDLGRMNSGEFYFLTEGSGRPGKLRAPLCLSYHPPQPPTPEEVVAIAARSAA